MTLYDLELKLQTDPKWFKRQAWQAQVVLVNEFLQQGYSMAELAVRLSTSLQWIRNCIKVGLAIDKRPEWNCKYAKSLQDAVTTANLRSKKEKRQFMEAKAREAASITRPIGS